MSKNLLKLVFFILLCGGVLSEKDYQLCLNQREFDQQYQSQLKDRKFQDFLQEIQKQIPLGVGKSGKVFEVRWLNNQKAALKIISYEKDKYPKNEITVLKLVNGNPYFPDFYECVDYQNKVYVFIEKLFMPIQDSNKVREKYLLNTSFLQRLKQYKGIALGIQYIHKNNFTHQDIKPKNIMISDSEYTSLKLIDMGFSSEINQDKIQGTFLTNAPEKNNPSIRLQATTDQDVYAYMLTLALIEVGISKTINAISKNDLKQSFRKQYFVKIKNFLQTNLSKKFNEKTKEPYFLLRLFRWIRSFFFTYDPLASCKDFICLVVNTIEFNPEERPNLQYVIEAFDRIIKDYSPKDLKITEEEALALDKQDGDLFYEEDQTDEYEDSTESVNFETDSSSFSMNHKSAEEILQYPKSKKFTIKNRFKVKYKSSPQIILNLYMNIQFIVFCYYFQNFYDSAVSQLQQSLCFDKFLNSNNNIFNYYYVYSIKMIFKSKKHKALLIFQSFQKTLY